MCGGSDRIGTLLHNESVLHEACGPSTADVLTLIKLHNDYKIHSDVKFDVEVQSEIHSKSCNNILSIELCEGSRKMSSECLHFGNLSLVSLICVLKTPRASITPWFL